MIYRFIFNSAQGCKDFSGDRLECSVGIYQINKDVPSDGNPMERLVGIVQADQVLYMEVLDEEIPDQETEAQEPNSYGNTFGSMEESGIPL